MTTRKEDCNCKGPCVCHDDFIESLEDTCDVLEMQKQAARKRVKKKNLKLTAILKSGMGKPKTFFQVG